MIISFYNYFGPLQIFSEQISDYVRVIITINQRNIVIPNYFP
jgi:hypothetical protein